MWDLNRIGLLLVALMTGYLLQIIEGAHLVINPAGPKQSQPAGKGFGLTCQGEGGKSDLFTEMKWIGPTGELHEGSTGHIEVSKMRSADTLTLVLMFKTPMAEDGGVYNCSAMFENIHKLNSGVELVFYQDITWEDCPTEQALVINNDGKIMCRVSANPPASITWSKEHQSLEDHYITETDGVKVIGVTEEDKGKFSVRAMVAQTGRFQIRTINVEVHVPPEIIELEEKAEAIEGKDQPLRCQASGFPRPVYSWLDPQQRDLSNMEHYTVDQDTGTLVILNVKRSDRGSYTCMAKNPAGETKKRLDLIVIVKPEIKEFSNKTYVENQDAVLECHAEGEPLPEMTIRKDGHDRPFSDGDDRITLNKREEDQKSILTLTIQRAIRSDDGLYYCAAENKGAHVERVGHLTVEFAPVMTSTPSTSVKTWKGNSVNVTCIAEAIPNATITWSFQGRELQNDDFYTIFGRSSHSNLLVNPSDNPGDPRSVYGSYKCEAENKHGSQYINIDLQEARKPLGITQVDVSKKTATTLTFQFIGPKDDGGLPIRAFVVEYQEEAQYEEPILHEWSEGTPYILEKLKPRTGYTFRFAAKNEVGIGDYSGETRIVMPAEAAPEPPRFTNPGGNVSAYPDHFEVRWTVPLDNGKEIDFFELRYFEVVKGDNMWRPSGEPHTHQITNWENAPLYVMQNLRPNTYYKVEVRAHNDIGFSQDATMVFQTAADPSKGSMGRPPISPPDISLIPQQTVSFDKSSSETSSTTSGPSITNTVSLQTGMATTDELATPGSGGSALSTSAIAAIIIVLVLVVLIALDATCYIKYQWGLMYLLRTKVCSKPITNDKAKEAAVEDGKGGGNDDPANNGNVKTEAIDGAAPDKGIENFDKKSRTEVDNPAFDAKDTKTSDGNIDDVKNKSPKGSKSSIAKDSLV